MERTLLLRRRKKNFLKPRRNMFKRIIALEAVAGYEIVCIYSAPFLLLNSLFCRFANGDDWTQIENIIIEQHRMKSNNCIMCSWVWFQLMVSRSRTDITQVNLTLKRKKCFHRTPNKIEHTRSHTWTEINVQYLF